MAHNDTIDPAADRLTAPPGRDGLAVTTFILGLLGFLVVTIPIGLITGIAGFARIRRTGRKGKGLAVAGLVLCVLWAAAIGAGAVTVLRSGSTADSVKVGDCLGDVSEGEVGDLQTVPCDSPKSTGKVYAVFKLDSGEWPGDDAVDKRAGDDCTSRYQKAGSPSGKDAAIFYVRPTADSWQSGDRRVVCVAKAS